jgi:hypothetical protein
MFFSDITKKNKNLFEDGMQIEIFGQRFTSLRRRGTNRSGLFAKEEQAKAIS